MLIKTFGSAVFGVNAYTVTIEVNVSTDGAKFIMVGLPDNAVKESWTRITTAFKNNGYNFPRKKVVVNLAPADIKKEGSAYDLTIAIGLLAADEQLSDSLELENYIIMGELSLDGTILPIKGALPIAIQALKEGFKGFILPKENAAEASIVKGLNIYGIDNIRDIINFFRKKIELLPEPNSSNEDFNKALYQFELDFGDVQGQENIIVYH